MQRLTYPRTILVPICPRARDAVVDFFCKPPRGWKFEPDAASVFKLKFFRGSWSESRWARWLGKTSLAKFLPLRRPDVPPHDGTKIPFDGWPAELNITMKTSDGRFELALVYEISIPGDGKAMSRDNKKQWKAAVEEDAHELFLRLTQLHEST